MAVCWIICNPVGGGINARPGGFTAIRGSIGIDQTVDINESLSDTVNPLGVRGVYPTSITELEGS